MPEPVLYADASQYLDRFSGSDTSQTGAINDTIEEVSRFVDGETGRWFGKDDELVERTYRVVHEIDVLEVDDMSEAPETVSIDGVELDEADYDLEPRNAPLGPEPRPYERIRLKDATFVAGTVVTVETKFGWPSVPPTIRRYTIEIAGILRAQSPLATQRFDEGIGSIIGASRSASGIVMSLKKKYRRTSRWTGIG